MTHIPIITTLSHHTSHYRHITHHLYCIIAWLGLKCKHEYSVKLPDYSPPLPQLTTPVGPGQSKLCGLARRRWHHWPPSDEGLTSRHNMGPGVQWKPRASWHSDTTWDDHHDVLCSSSCHTSPILPDNMDTIEHSELCQSGMFTATDLHKTHI